MFLVKIKPYKESEPLYYMSDMIIFHYEFLYIYQKNVILKTYNIKELYEFFVDDIEKIANFNIYKDIVIKDKLITEPED